MAGQDERREFQRIEGKHLISYRRVDPLSQEYRQGVAITENISLGGVKVELEERFDLGATLHFEVAIQERIISFIGKVTYCEELGPKRFGTGLKFVLISDAELQELRDLLQN